MNDENVAIFSLSHTRKKRDETRQYDYAFTCSPSIFRHWLSTLLPLFLVCAVILLKFAMNIVLAFEKDWACQPSNIKWFPHFIPSIGDNLYACCVSIFLDTTYYYYVGLSVAVSLFKPNKIFRSTLYTMPLYVCG